MHFPISYYFSAADSRFSLPVAAPYLLEIARRGMKAAQPMTVRFRSRLLMQAIDDLAKTTAARFHGSGAPLRHDPSSGSFDEPRINGVCSDATLPAGIAAGLPLAVRSNGGIGLSATLPCASMR